MKNAPFIVLLALGLGLNACSQTSTPSVEPSAEAPVVESFSMILPSMEPISQYFRVGHQAIDFDPVDQNTRPNIQAAQSGTVTEVTADTFEGGYGNYILIDHGNGYVTRYAHCDETFVKKGDVVTQGQVIATMGDTGSFSEKVGIHLHFELMKDGVRVDPMEFFTTTSQ